MIQEHDEVPNKQDNEIRHPNTTRQVCWQLYFEKMFYSVCLCGKNKSKYTLDFRSLQDFVKPQELIIIKYIIIITTTTITIRQGKSSLFMAAAICTKYK